ncbi:hypothetical protein BFF78_41235 [Streptomyces fodineus]|uniref:Uncharacterized protein n=1 Tax=Streptomyces fodineus TaxID=1904616 RepID=A0A1D7YM06_9ACTN|nr:hypothetical protein [Streptomyces fodineus]AOR36633.1 hypothetical protein BFF78_41235 [Streptomyces fodineus]
MRTKTAALALAGGALIALAIPVSSAQAAPTAALSGSCQGWHDNNTYGAGACTGFASGDLMQASAECNNGSWAYGKTVSATNGSWSYAYCAGKGGYKLGTGGYIVFS